MTARGARAGSHVAELDGVRGIAIAMVMALHFICSQVGEPQSRVEQLAGRLTAYGTWGVDLFFVLSGFLITGILWDTRGSGRYFASFYARRTLRIFPLYYATLLVLIVLVPRGLLERVAPDALEIRALQGWLWPYLTNVYIAKSGGFNVPYISHFWTLAVEEHFYLVWPFVVGLLARSAVLWVSIVAAVAALSLRIVAGYVGWNEYVPLVLTPFRLDALCIGACLALAVRGPAGFAGMGRIAKLGLVASAAGVLATSLWHVVRPAAVPALPARETFLALMFGFAIVLACWADGPAWFKALLRLRFLRLLGKYSYGLYVFHGIIAFAFVRHGTLGFFARLVGSHSLGLFVQAAFGSVVSMLIAWLSYEYLESRFLRLKVRFEPKYSGAAVPAAGTDGVPAVPGSTRAE
ncbi:MAG TPA: acyltransferase [Polyangiaceae bacterium]|nr:acyltransferase [Polyangiaceae bacterium]